MLLTQVKTEIIGNVKKPFFPIPYQRPTGCMFRSHPVSVHKCFIRETPIPIEPTWHSDKPSCSHLSVSLKELDWSYGVGVELTQADFFLPWTPCWVVAANIHHLEDTLVSALSWPFTFPIKGKPLRVDGCVSIICVVSIMQLRSVGRRPGKKHTQLKDKEWLVCIIIVSQGRVLALWVLYTQEKLGVKKRKTQCKDI